MTVFNPNPNKPINNNGGQQSSNYPKVEASRDTEFGTIDPKNNTLIQYNLVVESTDKESNNTTNIRTTLTPAAIRSDKFDFYSGKFDPKFPGNDVYTFCNPELSIVFQNGAYQYTRKVQNDSGYPLDVSIEKVADSVQQNQYGKNYSGDCQPCPGNVPPDPITGLCVPPRKCIPDPDPEEPCPEPELVNLKPTIYGYAVYVDTLRSIYIPNIDGQVPVRCAGGHRCNGTHFRPKLKLNDDSIALPSNNISLDNHPYRDEGIPQYNPFDDIAFFAFTDSSGRRRTVRSPWEVTDSFTFTVNNPSLIDNTCEFYLECVELDGNCHYDVTMIYLVGQRSDNDEYVLIFADCIAPGNINAKFLGTVPCNNDEPPVECDPPPPPPTLTPPPSGDVLYCCYNINGEYVCRNAVEMGYLGDYCTLNFCPPYCS